MISLILSYSKKWLLFSEIQIPTTNKTRMNGDFRIQKRSSLTILECLFMWGTIYNHHCCGPTNESDRMGAIRTLVAHNTSESLFLLYHLQDNKKVSWYGKGKLSLMTLQSRAGLNRFMHYCKIAKLCRFLDIFYSNL